MAKWRPGTARALAIAPAVLAALAGTVVIVNQWSGGRPFWVDEEMIAINIRDRSVAGLAGKLWLGQSAPLAWLWLEKLAMAVGGTSEKALRFVPAMFGVATLAGAVWIGRRWMTAAGAFVLTLLCAFGLWMSFFPLELKHYSADAFWGLILPALAAWAAEARDAGAVRRRAVLWWTVAALAHWLSNGGLLAAPGCALALFALIWKRHGAGEAAIFALAGVAWLASFAIYYELSLSHTHNNRFLRTHWSGEFVPAGAGPAGTLQWLASRFEPLAWNPGGTTLAALFWICAVAGLALGRARVLAAMFVTLPIAAFALVAAGLVPLYERFSLWMVPALYAGVAMLADRAWLLARGGVRRRHLILIPPAAAMAIAVVILSRDIVAHGVDDMRHSRSPATNHGLHDRDSVQWLLAQRKPGDTLLTTRLGWPAVWWYGEMRPQPGSAGAPEGLTAYEIDHRWPGADCAPEQLRDTMRPHARALIHVGFPDMPEGYGDLLLRHLDQLGAIAYYREFGHDGFAAVVDLHTPQPAESTLELIPRSRAGERRLAGCIGVAPARLW